MLNYPQILPHILPKKSKSPLLTIISVCSNIPIDNKLVLTEGVNHMNFMKSMLYAGILTASCNALGMHGFGHELTSSQATIQEKEASLTILGLQHVNKKNQKIFFELLNDNNRSKNEQFGQLVREARQRQRTLPNKKNMIKVGPKKRTANKENQRPRLTKSV